MIEVLNSEFQTPLDIMQLTKLVSFTYNMTVEDGLITQANFRTHWNKTLQN